MAHDYEKIGERSAGRPYTGGTQFQHHLRIPLELGEAMRQMSVIHDRSLTKEISVAMREYILRHKDELTLYEEYAKARATE